MTGSAHDQSATGGRHTRNVAIVGPQGVGKTMLMESLLHTAGATHRLGSVLDGTTVSDHTDAEKRIGHSVHLAVATFELRDPELTRGDTVSITLLDTPGHPDFVGELRAGLRAADAALFVISGVDGVDPATVRLWRECALAEMPRAVVVTHLDADRADYQASNDACQAAFGDGVHPIHVPQGDAVLSLLSRSVVEGDVRRDATDDELGPYEGERAETLEAIITEAEDETLLERYLGGEEVTFGVVVDALESAIARSTFYPVLPANPTTGQGMRELLELIARGFPTPAERHMPAVFSVGGVKRPGLDPSPDAPLVAEVIKTSTDAYVGRVSVVRIFSGTLAPDSQVHISGHLAQFTGEQADDEWHAEHDEDTRGGGLSRILGGQFTQVDRAVAGDVVAVSHLDTAETGDTISAADDPVVVEPWTFPHPLLPVALHASSIKDDDKLMRGLSRIQAENPTTHVVVDAETKQLVLWTMGEHQLGLLLEALRDQDGIEVETEPVRVAVHETVRAKATGTGRHVKQSGGHGQYAIAHITIEPLPEGGGFEFVDEVVGGEVPRQFIPSVEKGVRSQMEKGVTGYPMVDVRVRLTGGKAHSVDSSDAAFQVAGALALRDAAASAGVQLLEPIDTVAVTIDDDYVGAVMSDLASRRGQVTGTEPAGEGGRTTVTALVPAFELVRYTQTLSSIGHGSGEFMRTPGHYAPAPATVQERLTAAAADGS